MSRYDSGLYFDNDKNISLSKTSHIHYQNQPVYFFYRKCM